MKCEVPNWQAGSGGDGETRQNICDTGRNQKRFVFSTNEKATVTHVGPYIGQIKYLE